MRGGRATTGLGAVPIADNGGRKLQPHPTWACYSLLKQSPRRATGQAVKR
jgi:hypothetical protein